VSTETLAERRVGLIVPSSNTVVEVDFARNLPLDATLHTARMFLTETTAAAERAMMTEYLPRAVEDLASLYPQVVAFACTSAGAVLGAKGEARLMEEIAEKTGARVVSTNDAVKNAIARHNPRRVAVITPYIDELNARIREGLEGRGLTVARTAGLGLTENHAIAMVPPAEIVAFAEQSLAGVDFDLLFISCTNFRALAARPQLLERFGVPVVTSNLATIEATLAALADASDGARAGVATARA
jgi:maleate isomerase